MSKPRTSIDEQKLGDLIAGAEASNSEAHSSNAGSTTGEVLATRPIIEA